MKDRRLLSAKQLRQRYGNISDMTLWRWLRDPGLGFPQPIYINGRRFFDEAAQDDFDNRQRHRAA